MDIWNFEVGGTAGCMPTPYWLADAETLPPTVGGRRRPLLLVADS